MCREIIVFWLKFVRLESPKLEKNILNESKNKEKKISK